MATSSVERQIAALRPTTGFAAAFHRWLLVGAAGGVIAAVVVWHPILLMLAIFLAIVGVSDRRAGPNVVAAIRAFDSGTPTLGEASIAITSGDTGARYRAIVREPGHPDWAYEFVPQGWQPTARTSPATIWRTGSRGQPVLAAVEEGVMIPRYDPKPWGTTN